ncbi:MAG: sulfite exporter TauE/SafE family protein, partial [Saprospiraceae bacterium]|nr:sulfite exporter TauE/SafE family protein [Saprospiraceae bacterium]
MEKVQYKHISFVIIGLKISLISWLVWQFFHSDEAKTIAFDGQFWLFCLAGFIAQIIDGALGMAYGV